MRIAIAGRHAGPGPINRARVERFCDRLATHYWAATLVVMTNVGARRWKTFELLGIELYDEWHLRRGLPIEVHTNIAPVLAASEMVQPVPDLTLVEMSAIDWFGANSLALNAIRAGCPKVVIFGQDGVIMPGRDGVQVVDRRGQALLDAPEAQG